MSICRRLEDVQGRRPLCREWRQGKNVLFRRHQAPGAGSCGGRSEALRDCYYVNQRLAGRIAHNMATVQKSIKRLKSSNRVIGRGYDSRPKKEVIRLERERKHLDSNLAGIKDMPGLPDVVFVSIRIRKRSPSRSRAVWGFPS